MRIDSDMVATCYILDPNDRTRAFWSSDFAATCGTSTPLPIQEIDTTMVEYTDDVDDTDDIDDTEDNGKNPFKTKAELEKLFAVDLPYVVKILVGWYWRESWEGYAFVLYEKFGELWEINAYHCSCYGLEGQWEAERALPAELRTREFDDATVEGNNALRERVLQVLDEWEATHKVSS